MQFERPVQEVCLNVKQKKNVHDFLRIMKRYIESKLSA